MCIVLGDDTSLSYVYFMRTKHLCVLIHIRNNGKFVQSIVFKHSSNLLTDRSKAVLLLWIFLLLVFVFIFVILPCLFPCSLVVTCWERADLFALWYMMFFLCVVTFTYGVLGQVSCLIVSITDICFSFTLNCFNCILVFIWLCYVVYLCSVVHVSTTAEPWMKVLVSKYECSCSIEFIKRVGKKEIKCEALRNTGAWIFDSIYHMTLKLL